MTPISSILEAREEARQLFNRGDYSETVRICDRLLTVLAGNPADDTDVAEVVRLLLNDKSRALRSLGQVQSALDCYVQALQSAHESGNMLDETWQLVQFGKIFGKYLERQTLFSACLREAARRYEIFMQDSDSPAPRLIVQFAIVQDLLGSYYRRLGERGVSRRETMARAECERCYSSAIKYHESADNVEGISRATCHLAYAKALFAHSDPALSPDEKTAVFRDSLRSFEEALRGVLRSPGARRGRATRRVQQAYIYLLLGNVDHAVHLLSEAITNAGQRNDPRAMVLARRMLATALIEQRKPGRALEELVQAHELAEAMRFIGFERHVLSELAELYLKLDEPQKAILALQKNESLFQKELLEFDSGFSGALEVFQAVAPERADLYLREGQRQDYEELISALIDTGRMLRQISRYERTQSIRFQSGIHRFAKISLGHSIKNELQKFSLSLLPLRKSMERKEPLEAYVSDLLESYAVVLERIKPLFANPPHEDLPEKASLREELTQAVQTHFTDLSTVNLLIPQDILFPNLMPGLLREAFLHLVENASAAIKRDPPPEGVPHFSVQQESGSGGSQIVLMNPGTNPREFPAGIGPSTILHGFANAYWFFQEVLGFGCRFELREDGPRTLPYLSNCVVIEIPPPEVSPTPYRIEPLY